jgi:hypothetical protein
MPATDSHLHKHLHKKESWILMVTRKESSQLFSEAYKRAGQPGMLKPSATKGMSGIV